MRYGIQRRTIYLEPPAGEDQLWLYRQFDDPQVWQMFGLPGPARLRVMRNHRLKKIVAAILRRTHDQKRLGFVVMFEPTESFDFWEFGYAIPDPKDRDAFSALYATDTMGHYMFEHLHVASMGWRTRADNKAADAIIRRLGYEPFGTWFVDGHDYTFYRIDAERWGRRKAKLQAYEDRHPSGLPSLFVRLDGPPYVPVQPKPSPGGVGSGGQE